jgi:hypothetical protein
MRTSSILRPVSLCRLVPGVDVLVAGAGGVKVVVAPANRKTP